MRWILAASAVSLVGVPRAATAQHMNPVVDLLAAKKPVFGLYAPANRRGGRGGQPALPPDSVKSPAQLALDAVAYKNGDYVFDGSMEGNFDGAFPAWNEFAKGMQAAGMVQGKKFTHPLFVKTPEIAPDKGKAAERIAAQLNSGASGIVFVGVESAQEVKDGLNMMRFKSKGGTRPDNIGDAATRWGLAEKDYKDKADVWPLNPKGELVNFTIVESKPGLANIREIAAVKGIGVLFPGAGTLRGVFPKTDASGKPILDANGRPTPDTEAWEAAIQQVLAACKEFNVPCGYPATANDIELRMKQGFSVFVIGWGDAGFKAVDIGKKAGGR
jgi:4-hydroxy-2-oxoheptanedioate aldolase